MRLNDAGEMVERWWYELMNKFPESETDEDVIMPNHFHGIVIIVRQTCVSALNLGGHIGQPLQYMVRSPVQRNKPWRI